MKTVNIGILAHVDAGKTSLTERLLFDTGTIDRLGSVDAGTTRTDTGEIGRRRGITIRSAVAAFTVGRRQVNLIDTPGHSDFVAEVERALRRARRRRPGALRRGGRAAAHPRPDADPAVPAAAHAFLAQRQLGSYTR
ncbi:GTP-binding protein [Micromonospora sp. BQ11]|uniref:GTP-binding protein n=1 Tax=Micromonospora sp. BQ11 TaxID=3452212 RepID=UPI003F8B3A8D